MTGSAEKVVEKVAEKLVEKRRALGRGLESLLPSGPRVVPTAAREQGALATRGEGAGATVASGTDAGPAGEAPLASAQGGIGTQGSSPRGPMPGVVDLQAMAARRDAQGSPASELPLDLIDNNPYQTRMDFEEE